MTINSLYTEKDFEIVKRDILYKGIFHLINYHFRHRLFNGEWSGVVSREVFERLSAVGLLPYDPINDRVVLIEQFRAGTISTGKNPWLIEIIAGCIEKNETIEEVALREAQEESGCIIKRLHPICDYFVSPGASNEYIHLFCGEIDSSSDGIHGLEEENEDIRAFTVSSDEAFAMLARGQIKNAAAIVALQWFQINRDRLRKAWA